MKNQPREKSKDASEVLVCASSASLRGSFAVSLLLTVFVMAFCLQQGSPSQVESDEEDHAADKQLLAEYDDDPVKAEQEYGADADFIQELREHVATKMAMKNKPRAKKEDVSEVLVRANSAFPRGPLAVSLLL